MCDDYTPIIAFWSTCGTFPNYATKLAETLITDGGADVCGRAGHRQRRIALGCAFICESIATVHASKISMDYAFGDDWVTRMHNVGDSRCICELCRVARHFDIIR